MMSVNDDYSIISKWSYIRINDATVVIYDGNMFILQATGVLVILDLSEKAWHWKQPSLFRRNINEGIKRFASFTTPCLDMSKNVNTGWKFHLFETCVLRTFVIKDQGALIYGRALYGLWRKRCWQV